MEEFPETVPTPVYRVLLAEDEFLIRLALAEEFTLLGHEVVEASSGDEALVLFDAFGPFDILVTDVQMFGMIDGIALASRLRTRAFNLPVVYVTGRPEVLEKLGKPGPRDALARKPFAPSELAALAAGLLATE